MSVRKNTSNFVLESPFMVPPSVHTKEKRKKDCSHCMLCGRGKTEEGLESWVTVMSELSEDSSRGLHTPVSEV